MGVDRYQWTISEAHRIDPANGKCEVQPGPSAQRVCMPWILRPSCDYAGRVAGGRYPYTRAHVLEVSRVFKQDYRTGRRVEEHLSHLDPGPFRYPHDAGPRGLGNQGAKDFRRNDLKLGDKPILQLRSKDRREVG